MHRARSKTVWQTGIDTDCYAGKTAEVVEGEIMHVFETLSGRVQKMVALDVEGVTLGTGCRLVRFDARTGRLGLSTDRERCLVLLAIATRAPIDSDAMLHLEAAASYWDRGDRALANLRLVFAGLPKLRDDGDVARLRAAEFLLDHGMTPRGLLRELDIDPAPLALQKYDPDQPRVPAGQGDESGRWTDGFWGRVGHWLEGEVPVYDTDTGDEVGTQSRGRAIATNPLTIAAAGTATFFAAEAAAAAAVVTAAETAEEALTPFAARYLSTSGGRLGGPATRKPLWDIAQEYYNSGKYTKLLGDGQGPEEYIAGAGPGTKGSTFVDFTAKTAEGNTVRVQTIDTLADGVTPTKAEIDAASRIRVAHPDDDLILIPKRPK